VGGGGLYQSVIHHRQRPVLLDLWRWVMMTTGNELSDMCYEDYR